MLDDDADRSQMTTRLLQNEPPGDDLLAVEEAVRRLEAQDPRKDRIVNLRYTAGLTAGETAHALDLPVGTIEHEWRFIKAWRQDAREEGAESC